MFTCYKMKFVRFLTLSTLCFCVVTTESTNCTTPNGEEASCVLLFSCPVLLNAPKDPESLRFLQASSCAEGNFMVCCGTLANFTNTQNTTELPSKHVKHSKLSKQSRREYVIKKLLPSRTFCGLQHTDDYFYTGSESSVDEFPWMVYIKTDTSVNDYSRVVSHSAGVLINNRYILTDTTYQWYTTTLGQHHIYKDVSCIPTGIDTAPEDCTKPSLDEFVDDYIIDEDNSIALLRLHKKVSYTDFIRPICLPLEESSRPEVGEIVVTSGWGEDENTEGKAVKLKKRIKHTLMNQEDCELGNPVPNPICGLTLQNTTSYVCPGDNGGPLMYRYTKKKKNWVVLGIVTRPAKCSKYQPVVAKKITPKIVNWILDNIKP